MPSRKYHYAEAERLLEVADNQLEEVGMYADGGPRVDLTLMAAQVHATLASCELFVAGA